MSIDATITSNSTPLYCRPQSIQPPEIGVSMALSKPYNTSAAKDHTRLPQDVEPQSNTTTGAPHNVDANANHADSAAILTRCASIETNEAHADSTNVAQNKTTLLATTRSSKSAPFPLKKLPPELRLNVYHQLFTDLTITRQRAVADLDKFHEADEWPNNDLSTYVNLILASKEINKEAKDLWEKQYTSKCCLYFWQMPKLFNTAQSLQKLGEPYQSIRYLLRTRFDEDEVKLDTLPLVQEDGTHFMACQPGFPSTDFYYYSTFFFDYYFVGRIERIKDFKSRGDNGRRIPVRIVTYMNGKQGLCARVNYPRLQSCEISVHQRRLSDVDYLHYNQMTGKFLGLCWCFYNAPVAHGKVRMYEEFARRWDERSVAGLDFVLDEEILRLANWWDVERFHDEKWLALGGETSKGAMAIARKYDLVEWLSVGAISRLV